MAFRSNVRWQGEDEITNQGLASLSLALYEPPAPSGPTIQPITTTTTGNRSRADTFQYDQDAIQLLPLNNVNPLQPRPAERAPDYYGEER
jgi:hypothetical protein